MAVEADLTRLAESIETEDFTTAVRLDMEMQSGLREIDALLSKRDGGIPDAEIEVLVLRLVAVCDRHRQLVSQARSTREQVARELADLRLGTRAVRAYLETSSPGSS